jgi:hypothetical protein
VTLLQYFRVLCASHQRDVLDFAETSAERCGRHVRGATLVALDLHRAPRKIKR